MKQRWLILDVRLETAQLVAEIAAVGGEFSCPVIHDERTGLRSNSYCRSMIVSAIVG